MRYYPARLRLRRTQARRRWWLETAIGVLAFGLALVVVLGK